MQTYKMEMLRESSGRQFTTDVRADSPKHAHEIAARRGLTVISCQLATDLPEAAPDLKISDFPLSWVLGLSAAALVLLLTCLFGLNSCLKPSPADRRAAEERRQAETIAWRTQADPELAYAIAQGFVEDLLIAPTTARFPTARQGRLDNFTQVGPVSDQRYHFNSWVDADNAFGVPIRHTWMAEVQRVGPDDWQLIDIAIHAP